MDLWRERPTHSLQNSEPVRTVIVTTHRSKSSPQKFESCIRLYSGTVNDNTMHSDASVLSNESHKHICTEVVIMIWLAAVSRYKYHAHSKLARIQHTPTFIGFKTYIVIGKVVQNIFIVLSILLITNMRTRQHLFRRHVGGMLHFSTPTGYN